MKTKFYLPFFALFVSCLCFGQSINKIDQHTQKVIDSTYTALLKKYDVVGTSIAIVDNGEIVYATGYGFADKANAIKADEKTIYRIGSCTKSFTALSVMQLQEKGLLDIHNSIKNYLPDLTITSRFNDDNKIYINDILCHVSGLPCDITNGFFCDAPPDIKWVINELNKQTTISPRLYKQAYSNVGFGLLGELVSRVGKTTYSSYVRDNIFLPLNMNSSYIDVDENLSKNFSKAYYKNKEIKEPLIRDQAAGLVHSNALDMGNYLKLYLNKGKYNNNQLVSEKSLNEMEKNHLENVLLNSYENWGYGLYTQDVLMKSDKDSIVGRIIGHGGDTYAFHADFGFIPELNVGVVVLTNTDNGGSIRSATKLLKLYLKEAKGKILDLNYKVSKPINNNEQECSDKDKIGKYNFGPFVMDVKNGRKIKFKQGPALIILSQKSQQKTNYTVKARLFRIVPIKIKNQELKFVKFNDSIYVKGVNTKTKEENFEAIKTVPTIIPNEWKAKYGNYIAIDNYKCVNCPFTNTDNISIDLSEDKNFIVLKIKGKTPDISGSYYLNILSNSICVTGGIGRGVGETVKILENGNIYYSGFEFKKNHNN